MSTPTPNATTEVCDGWLWLNDSRKGEKHVRMRVVGRRRHRTGKVAWFATTTSAEDFPASDVVRLYFERWPAQEHVYRDGSGAVGLDVPHGYGKKKVTDIAVVDRLEKLDARERRVVAAREAAALALAEARRRLGEWEEAESSLEASTGELRAQIAAALREGLERAELEALFEPYATFERWLAEARGECRTCRHAEAEATGALRSAEGTLRELAEARAQLERRREIFTVDVELDELMTAFKLTFMNLCSVLMREYLGTWMELETLIDAVLTLPGERVVTATTETVRVFRPSRDAKTLAAVERACVALTARGLQRGERALRFEVVAGPGERAPRDPVDPRLRP